MNEPLVIALDVGGSSVKSALVATGPKIVGEVSVHSIDSKARADEILEAFSAIIAGHLKDLSNPRGIAMAFPGPFDYRQGVCLIQDQAKYDTLYGVNVSASLRGILGLPDLEIRYRNDAEAAILGEALYGAGAGFPRLLGLTLGTGLGSAFVADGTIITMGPGVPDHGWLYSQPYGGQRADDVFSTRGLLVRMHVHGIQATDIASVLAAANEHHDVLAEVFASFGTDLGTFLKPFVSDFRADGVLVTGGIAEASDRFAPSLERSLRIPVIKGIMGARAALLGVAALYF